MFRLSCASKAVRQIAAEHGFSAVSQWEAMNAGRSFWDMHPEMVAVRVKDSSGRVLEITAGELIRVSGEIAAKAKPAEPGGGA